MKIAAILSVSVLISLLSSSACRAQGDLFGQNLHLFSVTPHTDLPEISFTHNGWQTRLYSSSGSMYFINDAGDSPIYISRQGIDFGLAIGPEGDAIGEFPDNQGFRIFANDSTDLANANINASNQHSQVALRTMLLLENNGPVRFEFANHDTNQSWAFQTNNSDGFLINRLGSGGNEFSIRRTGMVTMGPGGRQNLVLDPVGNLSILGTLSQSSDRNRKTRFESVDTRSILDSVRAMPISTWQYRDDDRGIRHLGPVSQDFYAAFQLGKGEKTIASVDADGVALASIQALADELEESQKQNQQLRKQVEETSQSLRQVLIRFEQLEEELKSIQSRYPAKEPS